jgi:hypothetical protein
VLRTFVLATIAVPIVIYGLMQHLHRLRTATEQRPCELAWWEAEVLEQVPVRL